MHFNDIKTHIFYKGASMRINDNERHAIWERKARNCHYKA